NLSGPFWDLHSSFVADFLILTSNFGSLRAKRIANRKAITTRSKSDTPKPSAAVTKKNRPASKTNQRTLAVSCRAIARQLDRLRVFSQSKDPQFGQGASSATNERSIIASLPQSGQ